MKKIILSTVFCSLSLFAIDSNNTNIGTDASVLKSSELNLIQTMLPNTKISKYQKSIIDGFYEIYFDNGQIIYVSPYKELMLFGEIMTKAGHSITGANRAKWQEELSSKEIQNSSIDKLIEHSKKAVFNKGSQNDYSFVLFTDPECPYCKTVETFFSENNTTVYFNFTPLPFHKNARNLSELALSSLDFKKTLNEIHDGAIPDIKITNDAKKQLENMEELGKALKVAGTPKIYVISQKDNKIVDVVNGANIPQLEKYLNK
ncbi:MAG: thioredoxin fold domain-containing protein [Sulfurimonas sp.]|jgi:thiol:disulfide interchange protein DsbC